MSFQNFEVQIGILLQRFENAVLEPAALRVSALRQHGAECDVQKLAARPFIEVKRLISRAT